MKRGRIAGKVFASVCCLFVFTGLKSITYYVSPSGNDNNSGTSSGSAWKTISKVNSINISPGTTILFEGGQIFSGSIYLNNSDANDPTSNVVISSYGSGKAIINSGAADGFYAYNTGGITVSNLIFEGSGMSTNTGTGVLFYADLSGNIKLSNIKILNVEVKNFGKIGVAISSWSGNTGYQNVIMDGLHVHHVKQNGIITSGYTSQSHTGYAHQNVTIKNTEVDNVPGYSDPNQHKGSGVILGQVDNGLIEKSAAHNNGTANTHCGGPGGIWAWDCNNITIQYCESYSNSSGTGCDGLGFDFDGGVTNSLMQYNYSHDNDGSGYLLGQYDNARPWANNVVRYNISENDGRTNAGGITLFKGAGTTMSGCKIYNNTIYVTPSATNSGVGAFTIINWNTGITGIEVYNNIFQTTGGAALIDIPNGYSADFKGNLYWSSGAAFKIKYQGSTYSSVSAWRNATGNEKYGNTLTGITADPLLKNAGGNAIVFPNQLSQLNAYILNAGSPAIDAGLDLAALFSINTGTTDFFGNPVYNGLVPDIGAHEATESITTGVGTISVSHTESIVVFPNPVRSGNPLLVKGATLPYAAEVISMTGALVWKNDKIEEREFEIPTINLSAGMYFVKTVDGGRKTVTKVVVE